MTAAALYMCSTPGCPSFTPTIGPCHDCQRARSLRRGRSGWDQQAKRGEYLAAHPTCAMDPTHPATHLDHTHPLSQGGTDTPDNWQALCRECHDRKTQWEREQG